MTARLRPGLTLALLLAAWLCAGAPARAQSGGSTISTEKIFAAIGLREGLTACEIGAGNGELSLAAARLVGDKGRVYASELGTQVKSLQDQIGRSGLTHITVVTGDPVKTNFPGGACDGLFMRNVYHHFADPAAMNASIAAALKPGARLAIVDFMPPPGAEAARPADRSKDGSHGIGPEALARELTAAGFEAVSTEAGAQRWFMVVVAKPKG
jgi:SAM-dependent methyltransferase